MKPPLYLIGSLPQLFTWHNPSWISIRFFHFILVLCDLTGLLDVWVGLPYYCFPIGMGVAWLALVQVLGRLNPSCVNTPTGAWLTTWDIECLWRDTTMSITGAGAPMSGNGEAHVDIMHAISFWSLRFHQIPLPQTGSIAPGLVQCKEFDSALVHTNLVMWQLRRTLCPGAPCSKDPEGEGCLNSLALVTVSSTSHHSTIVVASRGRRQRIHPRVRKGHCLTSA